jgi:hypothetical protein
MIEDFLNGNKEVYLNFGGDKLTDYRSLNENRTLTVQFIEAEEIWTRNDTGMDTQLLSLTVHLENGTLLPMTQEDLFKLAIHSGERNLGMLLKEKEFYFRILSINADPVSREESPKYMKALKKYAWNQVKEYVKYD